MQLSDLQISLVEFFMENPERVETLEWDARGDLICLTLAHTKNTLDLSMAQMIDLIESRIASQVKIMEELLPGSSVESGIPQTALERTFKLSLWAMEAGDDDESFFVHVGELLNTHARYIDALRHVFQKT